MKKILVVTPRYPYPVVGGDRLRIYYICRELSKNYSLTLLSLCETREEMQSELPADGVFDCVERVYLPVWRSRLNTLMAILSGKSLQIAYYTSREFAKRVSELQSQHGAVLAHLIRGGQYCLKENQGIRLLEMTDAISLNYQRVKALGRGGGVKAWIYRLEASRVLQYEKAILPQFDLATLVSHVDLDFLGRSADVSRAIVASNGVDLSQLPYRAPDPSLRTIVYIGNMTSVQNLDACWYFIESILPRLRMERDVKFRIIGRIGSADALKLSKIAGVEVTGSVASIASAAAGASLGVCPIRIGAGIQNKVLEYMALGLPTITSSMGLEGISALPGESVLLADSVDDYVHHLRNLSADPSALEDIALRGRAYVEANHDWSARLAPMLERVHSLLDPERAA